MFEAFTTHHKAKKKQPSLRGSQASSKQVLNIIIFRARSTCRPLEGDMEAEALVECGMFNAPPRKPFCLFCGEDKGHTTRTFHHTINKQKEIASSASQPSQLKEVFSTSLYCSSYVPYSTFTLNHRSQGYFDLRPQMLPVIM